ncbi:MAG: glycosyltransferase [Promethearchaeota archaeon]
MKPKKISIVVPTYNRVNLLERLLISFDKLIEFPEEIIIVNDGSEDQTIDLLKEWESHPHEFTTIVFNNPKSQGPGMARNIGIMLSSGDGIAFTDDDCIVSTNWIKMIKNSNRWNGEKIAGIGGRVLPFRKGVISRYFTFHRILEPPKYCQYLVTANACYYREKLLEVDGFDATHRYPGGEDNGLSFKLAKLGYKFQYERKMIVVHDYRTSIPNFIKTFFRYGKGCAEISYKYFSNKNENYYKIKG